MAKDNIGAKKVTTPKARVSFPHVFKAHAMEDGQEAKFSCVFLFDKKTDLSAMRKAANTAAVEKWGADQKKWSKNMRTPFRDGDEKSDLKGYEGTTFVTARSKKRPGIVDNNLNLITEEDESFYAGCYARATLIAFAYDVSGNKGVAFSLQNLQKLGDGEKFGGRRDAADEFDAVEDGSNNPDNFEQDEETDGGF